MVTCKKLLHEFIAQHSVLFFAIVILIIVIIGTLAFYCTESRDLFHSFYFTTITMATVGYGDMAPMTYPGKILAIIYGFMGAPLFIGLTWILFQSKFQKIVKNSIHAYHKEAKETEKMAIKAEKENKKQNKEIKEIEEEIEEEIETK